MVYNALDDTLSMEIVGAFLELWLGMTFLELWHKMEGKNVAISGCGLVILVTSVNVRVVARTNYLHLIRQSQFVVGDVANFVMRVQIVLRIGNST